MIGASAAWSVLLSEMPVWAAVPLAAGALFHAFLLVRRERRKPARQLVFPGGSEPVQVDGAPIRDVEVRWRGPLAFVSWTGSGGRRQRLSWWPDTLPRERRRELRLAAGHEGASRRRPGMAP